MSGTDGACMLRQTSPGDKVGLDTHQIDLDLQYALALFVLLTHCKKITAISHLVAVYLASPPPPPQKKRHSALQFASQLILFFFKSWRGLFELDKSLKNTVENQITFKHSNMKIKCFLYLQLKCHVINIIIIIIFTVNKIFYIKKTSKYST